eukprot:3877187-Rhodomonas_salina.1
MRQMNDQMWLLQLKTSATALAQAERVDDVVWLVMRTEYTQQVLWTEVASFPLPRRWRVVLHGT